MSPLFTRPNVAVVSQHAVDTAFLWHLRNSVAVKGPHYRLAHLLKLDNRIAAHLDGLAIASSAGAQIFQSEVDAAHPGFFFGLTILALQQRYANAVDRILEAVSAEPTGLRGMLSAFGWLERSDLRGIVAPLLASPIPFRRRVALAVCGVHRVDPGFASRNWFENGDLPTRARATRVAGEVGSVAHLNCFLQPDEEAYDSRFWMAWSAVMLGDRQDALKILARLGLTEGPLRDRALQVAFQASDIRSGHDLLQQLASDGGETRRLIEGSGFVGELSYVSWLIRHMGEDAHARVAGEAFSLISGADLALLDLERKPSEDFESGPNDDPEDPNVDMDPDDGLPWPDPDKIERWWAANEHRFQKGQRYFMGKPVTREHCIDVLKNGYQRQRILAAHYLCLLEPGTPLFNTSAPAWRQQKLLATM
jgi:uncharacterized protein (TIGR02270 family)